MKTSRLRVFGGLVFAGLSLFLAAAAPVFSQTQVPVVVIKSISVEGISAVDKDLVLSSFTVKEGDNFDRNAVSAGIRKLYSLGLFSDVQIDGKIEGNSISLIVRVKERERILKVEFKGNKKIGDDSMKEKISTSPGQLVDGFKLAEDVDKILSLYKEEGRPLAKVRWFSMPADSSKRSPARFEEFDEKRPTGGGPGRDGEGPGDAGQRRREFGGGSERDERRESIPRGAFSGAPHQVTVVFEISEGPKVKVRSIAFSGVSDIPENQLRKVMATKKKAFLRSGAYKDEYADKDIEKLEAFLKNRGYKDAKVTGHLVNYSEDNRWVDLNVEIEEGQRYTVGSIKWEGNKAITDKEAVESVVIREGTLYDEEKVEKSKENLLSAYAEKGYLFVSVTPQMTPQDSVLDIVFVMQEGEISHVRDIKIAGNTKTKDKVVRRELYLKPGDPFKRSLLGLSQRDVFNLRIFEDVQVDYDVDENGKDIDLIFKVKEKQTGTANAGFGYGTATGLTGFAELGHNNLFGNNQSLSLRLERGKKRNNIELSFTEPWLLDTPTTSGFEIYNTERVWDFYTENRKGGSIFAERLIPGSNVVRGSATYRFEEVSLVVDQADSTMTASQIQNLNDLRNETGKPVRTSSVTFGFRGTTLNNPFRPSSGIRFKSSAELAGGPFGGDVNFHKYLFDGRIYKRWFYKPVFMFRGRVGYVTGYSAKDRIPTYEKFRLGGTVYDYLRGYPDYYVVPDGNSAWAGGRFMLGYTTEYQFPIAEPLRGLLFYDIGGTWNGLSTFRASQLKQGFGFGFRIDVPMLGEIGFDYGYGINRKEGARWEPHLQFGGNY